jgi:hypothetical protein
LARRTIKSEAFQQPQNLTKYKQYP